MRMLTTSALLALLTAVATAQPPPAVTPPPKKTEPTPAPKAAPKPDPTDAAIAAALANDADVKMAKAKIQLAEAELAKARQAVTLKVMSVKGMIEKHTAELRSAEVQYGRIEAQVRAGAASGDGAAAAREKMEVAKAALAAAETELKLLTGGGPVAPDAGQPTVDKLLRMQAQALADKMNSEFLIDRQRIIIARLEAIMDATTAVKGPIPDRIRAALDKPVTLAAKGQTVTLAKALDEFKRHAGLDVPVRGLDLNASSIVSQGEELPVVAWFQVFQDQTGMTVYVREYGLLFADKKNAPADAPTLTEFWKQKPPAPKDAAPKK